MYIQFKIFSVVWKCCNPWTKQFNLHIVRFILISLQLIPISTLASKNSQMNIPKIWSGLLALIKIRKFEVKDQRDGGSQLPGKTASLISNVSWFIWTVFLTRSWCFLREFFCSLHLTCFSSHTWTVGWVGAEKCWNRSSTPVSLHSCSCWSTCGKKTKKLWFKFQSHLKIGVYFFHGEFKKNLNKKTTMHFIRKLHSDK